MNEYRGRHTSSRPWAVSSTASPRYNARHTVRNRRRRAWKIAGLILAVLLLAMPFIDALIVRIDRVSLASEDLPADIGRLRVVYVSDIHYGFFFGGGRLGSLVDQINSLKPDLVLFGGGYATDNDSAVAFFRHFPSIHCRYAMLGVVGDSDRGDNDLSLTILTDAMRDAGVTPVVNSCVPVRIGNSLIYVAGLDDVLTGKPDIKSVAAQASAGDFVIFLSHNPSVIPEAQRATDRNGRIGWFDLALFGHTHGGQLAVLGPLLNIGGDVENRYMSGWMNENRANLLVSNGVGTSRIPARLFRPAQIHCIDISIP